MDPFTRAGRLFCYDKWVFGFFIFGPCALAWAVLGLVWASDADPDKDSPKTCNNTLKEWTQ